MSDNQFSGDCSPWCTFEWNTQSTFNSVTKWNSLTKHCLNKIKKQQKRLSCCNHSVGIALNVQFTMNGMCAKNNTTYMWREQAITEWLRCMISIVACCQCEALRTCCSGFSDHKKMVLWSGCGGRAVWSLHKKNVRSVWFVVKRRGCCCNRFADVALNVRFTTNRMCTRNNTTHMWHKQAIIEWLQRMISIVACCHSAKLCAHAAWLFWSQQS